MRPDLFAGPTLRDDRHRILARLANGGSVPVPARQWLRWEAPQRARLAAVATLLATGAAAWVWLQSGMPAQDLPRKVAMPAAQQVTTPSAAAMPAAAPQQAATIVSAAMPENEAAGKPPPVPDPRAATGAGAAKPSHQRPARVAGTQRRQQNAATVTESDEDVTLLAAMLKHAKPQKPVPTQPKD